MIACTGTPLIENRKQLILFDCCESQSSPEPDAKADKHQSGVPGLAPDLPVFVLPFCLHICISIAHCRFGKSKYKSAKRSVAPDVIQTAGRATFWYPDCKASSEKTGN
ncbi:hypothetical protein MRS76_22930 [Rhizobiaceae bacterium n13]|uniref:Uncharacterized protein n=1 Tax=Ferirhizobium litorale TaxID=2927786 RepID=A0AAE3U051_9HYPH|nr:hypothetical protein [Fererhizobium litorale]MDI7864787.1 hypothetical protein [Fererhizobium litorale]MDI7921699.1 hypothetical protein [Fererhizobium litorale]